MNLFQIVFFCLAVSSLFLIAYVSFNNYHAIKKIDKNHFNRIDLV